MSLSLSESAIAHLLSLEKKKGAPVALRLVVKGGGCSGFRYDFFVEQVTEELNPEDMVCSEKNSPVQVVMNANAFSLSSLDGGSIDYERSMMGERFVLFHPKFASTCGCGNSFSMD